MYFNFSYLLLIHLFFFVCFLNWLYLSLSSPCAASILIPYKVSLLSVLKFFICCLFPILFCEALCNFVWKEKKNIFVYCNDLPFVLSLLYFDPLLHLLKGTSPLSVLLCVISRWLWGPLIRPCCDAVGFQYGAGCGNQAISCANAGGQSRSGS